MYLLQSNTEGGIAYPLNFKRLKFRYIQRLTSTPDFANTATHGYLDVMISVRLITMPCTNVKRYGWNSVGHSNFTTFSKQITYSQSDFEGEAGSFTAQMTQLQNVL